MSCLYNKKGIALVTSLMFTVITLVITMSLLYMVTAGSRVSGEMKRYKTASEAAYGGADILLKDVIQHSINIASTTITDSAFVSSLVSAPLGSSYLDKFDSPYVSSCFRAKLTTHNSNWITASPACAGVLDTSLDATKGTDVRFNLNSVSGTPYTVYSKIVDTSKYKIFQPLSSGGVSYKTIAGNSCANCPDIDSSSESKTSTHYPYRYRIEVQAERSQDAVEKSKLTVQYLY